MKVPERKAEPDWVYEKPVAECFVCGKELYAGEEVMKVEEGVLCMDDYCIAEYFIEEEEIIELPTAEQMKEERDLLRE